MSKTKTKMKDYMPEEIKLDILHRLPIKSIVRFTVVSKTWLSLIKSPSFISIHLNLSISSSNKNPLLLLRLCYHENQTEHYSLHYDDENLGQYIHFNFPFKTHNLVYGPYFRIVGTINGLICLADDITCTIIIWNPMIKKYVSLPKPSITCHNKVSFGFGFDSGSGYYKVLRVVKISSDDGDEDNLEAAEVYSLDTNSWKRIGIGDGVSTYKINWSARQVFVNGVVHFVASRRVSGVVEHQNFILGFNVRDEVFNEIMLPPSLDNLLLPILNVFVSNELIVVVEAHPFGGLHCGNHVWVMEEYGVVQSWKKIFSLNGLADVLGFRKNGELFLLISTLDVVSLKQNLDMMRFGIHGGRGLAIDYFVQSIVLLNNANAENEAIGVMQMID